MDIAAWRAHETQLVADLATLVGVESPSAVRAATAACADVLDALVVSRLGVAAERVVVDECTHLRWRFGGAPRVLLVGHLDTVWPSGTLARWPFSEKDGIATGPGCFDMKAGLVQMVHALASLSSLDGIVVVVNSDEELGSLTSRALIEESAAGCAAALVLEPAAGGALKTARKGVSMYDLEIVGRAAHAGLEPEQGVNASIEAAHQILAMSSIADARLGTTVTPTVMSAGTTMNTVPAAAAVHVDVRVETADEQVRVDRAMQGISPVLDGASVVVRGGPNRPPFERALAEALFGIASRLTGDLGLPPLAEVMVGGGSDGNFTAGIGVPTLDGLGAVGGNAHAEGEWVDVRAMPERAALVAALIDEIRS